MLIKIKMKSQTQKNKSSLIDDLNLYNSSCTKCTSCINDKKIYGRGNLNASICVVGEGPGGEEYDNGSPFVGPAGQLLMRILSAIDIKEEDVYFTNVVICRTSDRNRTPSQDEVTNCSIRLFNELSIVKPKMTILAGATALKAVFGSRKRIGDCHGKWFTSLSEPSYFYFPIYHPSWILHASTPGEIKARKFTMWKDIQVFRDDLEVMNMINFNKDTNT